LYFINLLNIMIWEKVLKMIDKSYLHVNRTSFIDRLTGELSIDKQKV